MRDASFFFHSDSSCDRARTWQPIHWMQKTASKTEKNSVGDINSQTEWEMMSVPFWHGVSEHWTESGWQGETGFELWPSITTERRDRAVVTDWQDVCGVGQQRPRLIWQYNAATEVKLHLIYIHIWFALTWSVHFSAKCENIFLYSCKVQNISSLIKSKMKKAFEFLKFICTWKEKKLKGK